MTNRIFSAAGVLALAGALQAQTVEKNVAFQYFVNNEAGGPMTAAMRYEPMNLKPVTNKPFSASEVRRTRQTLGDGTHIDKTETDKYYRDNEGRTRIERDNGSSVMISDPQTGAMTESNNG